LWLSHAERDAIGLVAGIAFAARTLAKTTPVVNRERWKSPQHISRAATIRTSRHFVTTTSAARALGSSIASRVVAMKLTELPCYDEDEHLNVVIESPRGAKAKVTYDPKIGAFKLSRPLPLGLAYPYDWGFIPSTLAPDGDPLDAMVYHESPTYPGILIACKPIGMVRLSEVEPGEERKDNDRLIVVPVEDERVSEVLKLETQVREELERFFVAAVANTDKKVRIEGWSGATVAEKLIDQCHRAFKEKRS
jgi:inorganic pyrophosphatase